MIFTPAPIVNTRPRNRPGVSSCRTANKAVSCGPSAAPATANATTRATGPPVAATAHAPACASAAPHSSRAAGAVRGSRAC
ncbi:hypothetical protein ACFWFX_29390, partial [Streptomyces roseolus]|uniref:hypothetical protein n=1 Tax=Streptomyces roseolus TaxID=67358 RepID=UPI003656742E